MLGLSACKYFRKLNIAADDALVAVFARIITVSATSDYDKVKGMQIYSSLAALYSRLQPPSQQPTLTPRSTPRVLLRVQYTHEDAATLSSVCSACAPPRAVSRRLPLAHSTLR